MSENQTILLAHKIDSLGLKHNDSLALESLSRQLGCQPSATEELHVKVYPAGCSLVRDIEANRLFSELQHSNQLVVIKSISGLRTWNLGFGGWDRG